MYFFKGCSKMKIIFLGLTAYRSNPNFHKKMKLFSRSLSKNGHLFLSIFFDRNEEGQSFFFYNLFFKNHKFSTLFSVSASLLTSSFVNIGKSMVLAGLVLVLLCCI